MINQSAVERIYGVRNQESNRAGFIQFKALGVTVDLIVQLSDGVFDPDAIVFFISIMVVCGMIKIFLSPSGGLLNLLAGTSIDFLTESSAFRTIYIASGIWQDAGWGIDQYFFHYYHVLWRRDGSHLSGGKTDRID